MNVICALTRNSPRPSWSVARAFCTLSEGLGGDLDQGFKPVKKKRKRVQPREVDVSLSAKAKAENVQHRYFQPSVFDASNRPDWKLAASVATNLREQSLSQRRFRTRSGPRCSQPPDDVTAEIGRQIEKCKFEFLQQSRAPKNREGQSFSFDRRLQSGGSYRGRSPLRWQEALPALSWSKTSSGEICTEQIEDRGDQGCRTEM